MAHFFAAVAAAWAAMATTLSAVGTVLDCIFAATIIAGAAGDGECFLGRTAFSLGDFMTLL